MVSLRPHLAGAVLIWLCSAHALVALDTNAVIEEIIAHQAKIETWQADFIQIRHLPSLKRPLRTPGKVWFRHTGEFRWELGQPARSIAIRDQKQITILSPRLKLAEIYPLDAKQPGPWRDAMALLEVGFPRSRAALNEKFDLSEVHTTDTGTLITLLPKQRSARKFLQSIRMEFDPAHNLQATEMTFTHTARIRTEFQSPEENKPVADSMFDTTVDKAYQISRPMRGRDE